MSLIPETLADNSICFSSIIYLGAQDNVSSALEDFCSWSDGADIKAILNEGGIPVDYDISNDDDVDAENLLEFLSRNRLDHAFLVEVSTPCPMFHGDGPEDYSFSWAVSTSEWFYACAINDVFVARLLGWRAAYYTEEHQRHLAANGKEEA